MNNESTVPSELGTKKVWPLLVDYAVPSVIAMTASSLYNITDSIFIGQGVGPVAIAGLAITFPLMNLGAAFGAMIGVGASTIMSLRLGQKDYDSANSILGNVFILNLIFGFIYTVVILTFMEPILYFFGASEESLPYAREYMTVVSLGNVITHMYLGLNSLLRATGKPRVSMYNTLLSVIINIILTPLFIYKFGWGIKGAAIATVIAQATMLIWQIRIFSDKREFIHLQRETFRLKKKIVVDSLSIGLAPFMMNVASSAIIIAINKSLSYHGGDIAIGAYGVINRTVTFFPLVVMGLNQGMQPIVGYNYGSKDYQRAHLALKYTILLGTIVLTIGFSVATFIPEQVSRLFTNDSDLIKAAAHGLRTVVFFFPLLGVQMVTVNFFQSIGNAKKATFLSLNRQVIFLLPLLIFLPNIYGVDGVWFSFRYADLFASITSITFLILHLRKISNNQEQTKL